MAAKAPPIRIVAPKMTRDGYADIMTVRAWLRDFEVNGSNGTLRPDFKSAEVIDALPVIVMLSVSLRITQQNATLQSNMATKYRMGLLQMKRLAAELEKTGDAAGKKLGKQYKNILEKALEHDQPTE